MRKEIMTNIVELLKDNTDPKAVEAVEELNKELNRNAEKAAKNRVAYDEAKDTVLGALTDKGVTIGELYAEVANDLPDGFTKAKVQYALLHYWNDEVVKIEGNPCTYVRK